MAIVSFKVEYPNDFKKTNDIILLVQEYGGDAFYGGERIFKIKCDRKVKRKLKKKIKDMLKS